MFNFNLSAMSYFKKTIKETQIEYSTWIIL